MSAEFIAFHADGPVNALFFALNHYISTGDRAGEGVALPDDTRSVSDGHAASGEMAECILAGVPYNPRELEDADNFRRLRARTDQITAEEGIPLTWQDHGMVPGGFRVMLLRVRVADIPAVCDALLARPGPLGWGSMKTFMDRYRWVRPDGTAVPYTDGSDQARGTGGGD